MPLGILQYGIAHRRDDGVVTLFRPAKNGGRGTEVEVPKELAEQFRLETGDLVDGETEPIPEPDAGPAVSPEQVEDRLVRLGVDPQREPVPAESAPQWLLAQVTPCDRLVQIRTINGLEAVEAMDRPSPRKRSSYERATPHTLVRISGGPDDVTGRMLDLCAPLGLGYAGILYGPHGSGVTRALQAVVRGTIANAPEVACIVLLSRARGEEITDWRRRFPEADVVPCPSPLLDALPEQTLRAAELTLACAQRQTELGRHVLLAVDTLTGLWGAMLEEEHADAQRQADRSIARQRVRDWIFSAGDFRGEGLLGAAGPGGSLTLVGTAWHQGVDVEAEEEGETHPHLRLLEHILNETSWRVGLSGLLAKERLFPAFDVSRCHSRNEESLLPPNTADLYRAARNTLLEMPLLKAHTTLREAIEQTPDNNSAARLIGASATPKPSDILPLDDIPAFDVSPNARPITLEDVKQAEDEP